MPTGRVSDFRSVHFSTFPQGTLRKLYAQGASFTLGLENLLSLTLWRVFSQGGDSCRPPTAEYPRGPSGSSVILKAGASALTVSTNCPLKSFCFRKNKIQCSVYSPIHFSYILCGICMSPQKWSLVSAAGVSGPLSWSSLN